MSDCSQLDLLSFVAFSEHQTRKHDESSFLWIITISSITSINHKTCFQHTNKTMPTFIISRAGPSEEECEPVFWQLESQKMLKVLLLTISLIACQDLKQCSEQNNIEFLPDDSNKCCNEGQWLVRNSTTKEYRLHLLVFYIRNLMYFDV